MQGSMNGTTQDIGFARTRFAVVLVAEPSMAHGAFDAVRSAGGRIATQIDWAGVPAAIGREADAGVMVLEARGVPPALLEAALPRIDSVATALDRYIVVMLGAAEIDLVAAMLLGPRVQLLCDPHAGACVAALTIAASLSGETDFHDRVREGKDGERLRRLNEDVARIAETLFRLTGRDGSEHGARDVADRRQGYGTPPSPSDTPVDPDIIRDAIRARRLRENFFGPGLFEDPAWDMLLDLFAAEIEGTHVSVSSLCIAAAVAPTTALRWITKLTESGLFVRHPDPFDRRRAYMTLSSHASEAMRGYVQAVMRQRIAIA